MKRIRFADSLIGRLVTGDPEPYRYLVESIARFPDAESFRDKVARAGSSGPRSRGYRVVSLPFIRAGNFRHESQYGVGCRAPSLAHSSRRDPERMDKLLKAHI